MNYNTEQRKLIEEYLKSNTRIYEKQQSKSWRDNNI